LGPECRSRSNNRRCNGAILHRHRRRLTILIPTGRLITRGKILRRIFIKKSEAPVEPVFRVYGRFFDGVLEKVGCWTWFFDGEIVVRCVVIVVKKMALF
jgi:hypothetical protein